MQKLKLLLGSLLLISLVSCNSTRLKTHVLPVPEDTYSKEISYQEKTSYEIDGIHVDNEFDIFWSDMWHMYLYTRGGPYWQWVKVRGQRK